MSSELSPILTLRQTAFLPLFGGETAAYQVLLMRSDAPTNVFANITPAGVTNAQGFLIGDVQNGLLGELDFTRVPNGVYLLVLKVRGGPDEVSTEVRIAVESDLKIGQFSFSEQDLVIPVNGIPLTVVRTYNSFNTVSGDFGYNWTYALSDMDVVIDEERAIAPALATLDGNEAFDASTIDMNLRTGGGRNVTLTLPDGRRTTFRFVFGKTTSGEECPGCVDAQWVAAPGVFATLRTPAPATRDSIGDNTLIPLGKFGPVWQGGGLFTPMEAFDFPEFVLTTQDGTVYRIERDRPGQTYPTYVYQDNAGHFQTNAVTSYIRPRPDKPRLTRIVQRTGDALVIDESGIAHYPPGSSNATRTISLQRDPQGRITEVRDPIGGSNGLPSVKYVYNQETGNLIQVLKLVDRATGAYLTNRYRYDHPRFPHYITSIEDARGIPVARNLYDDTGRLIGMIDAAELTNSIMHNLTNRVEIVTDR